MDNEQKVDRYIAKHDQWANQLTEIRILFQNTQLTEELKWGSPIYTLNEKNVAGFAAFKNHFAIWFHQGVFLKDKKKQLVNAQRGVTRGLRQWRFEKGDIIDSQLISEYIQEAIENCIAGKEIKAVLNREVTIPPFLKECLDTHPRLFEAFNKLTPGRQREYANYIKEAKRISTKQSRLDKITSMILKGSGLNDKYKNC